MNNQQLLELIKRLPLKNFTEYGAIISAIDIYDACADRGVYDKEGIKNALLQLGNARDLIVIHSHHDDTIVIGIKFHE